MLPFGINELPHFQAEDPLQISWSLPYIFQRSSQVPDHPKSGYLKRLSPSQINTLPFPYLA